MAAGSKTYDTANATEAVDSDESRHVDELIYLSEAGEVSSQWSTMVMRGNVENVQSGLTV